MSQLTRPSSVLIPLVQTLFISVGGFLTVRLMATATTMSAAELLTGPLSVALLWAGIGRSLGPSQH